MIDPAAATPSAGEIANELVRSEGVSIVQIVSGPLDIPVDYRQDDHEWAAVLTGRAVLEVGPDRMELQSGEWVHIPAGVPHRLVETDPGTNWITVHWPVT